MLCNDKLFKQEEYFKNANILIKEYFNKLLYRYFSRILETGL